MIFIVIPSGAEESLTFNSKVEYVYPPGRGRNDGKKSDFSEVSLL